MDSSSPHPRRLRPILKGCKRVIFSPFTTVVVVDKLSSNHLWYSDGKHTSYAFLILAVIYQFIAKSTPLSYIFLFLEDFECFKRQKIQMVLAIKSIGISKLDTYSQDTSIFLGKVRVCVVLS